MTRAKRPLIRAGDAFKSGKVTIVFLEDARGRPTAHPEHVMTSTRAARFRDGNAFFVAYTTEHRDVWMQTGWSFLGDDGDDA